MTAMAGEARWLRQENEQLRRDLAETRALVEVAQAELRQLRQLRDRMLLAGLDAQAAHW